MSDEPISSPCVSVCKVDDGACIACGRTVKQIAEWGHMTEAERKEIMDEL